jgi:5'-nucleotidase
VYACIGNAIDAQILQAGYMAAVKILLSNDDGFDAPGLLALKNALEDLGEVWVVAPHSEQSAKSHAFTMNEPLRILEHGPRFFAVTGTPADCVYLACHHVLPSRPDLVVSGINRGSNLSTDVHYSGTVAAAREGTSMDIPSIAVSLYLRSGQQPDWRAAQHYSRQIAEKVLVHGLPRAMLLNLNVPNLPPEQVRGLQVCPTGRRYYHPYVAVNTDPRGKRYFWIGGEHDRFDDAPGSDGPLCEEGWATLTPLQLDPTAHSFLPQLERWWATPA